MFSCLGSHFICKLEVRLFSYGILLYWSLYPLFLTGSSALTSYKFSSSSDVTIYNDSKAHSIQVIPKVNETKFFFFTGICWNFLLRSHRTPRTSDRKTYYCLQNILKGINSSNGYLPSYFLNLLFFQKVKEIGRQRLYNIQENKYPSDYVLTESNMTVYSWYIYQPYQDQNCKVWSMGYWFLSLQKYNWNTTAVSYFISFKEKNDMI